MRRMSIRPSAGTSTEAGDTERRVWRATQADQFTALDRRLIAAQDSAGRVEDGVGGTDAWAALSRGRLRHLEALGLAT